MELKHIYSIDPSTCISGKMMRISRLTANIFRKHISPFHITDSQLSLLFMLFKIGGLTQKQLTERLHMEKSSLNRNLKRLLDRAYITRAEFPIIRITKEGAALLDTVVPEWQKAMTEIRSLLDDEGETAVNTILSKLQTPK